MGSVFVMINSDGERYVTGVAVMRHKERGSVMSDFKIITNTTADLPQSFIDENDLGLFFFNYTIDGQTYSADNDLDYKVFYEKVRSGSMPSTSQVNPETFRAGFTQYLKESKNLLYLSFSSGLSGSCSNANLVAQEMMEENPDIRIKVIDTLAASMGEGLVVYRAVQMKKEGKSFEETAAWIEEHVMNFTHVFTVDDLNHLYRGGRVSKTTAVIGTMINIKPILHVDEAGHLIPIAKVRGRKKSLHELVNYMEKRMGSWRDKNRDVVLISHGDCIEDAQAVADEVRERFGMESFLINHIGPTIGAHSGPGTVALFFMGEGR